MPVIRMLPLGYSGGCAPPRDNTPLPPRPPRGRVTGWSPGSLRRNVEFLRSVRLDGLDGHGYALTLTLGRCPESAAELHSLWTAYTKRLVRVGLVRYHWVVEWTRAGQPHLHASVWFDGPPQAGRCAELVANWLEVTAGYRTLERAQHAAPLTGFACWARYLAKHAARGIVHYQRSRRALPPGWQSSGRMWGYGGTWDRAEPERAELTAASWHAFRRLVRAAAVAECRRRGDWKGVAAARRLLRCHDAALSGFRGLSQWSSDPDQPRRLVNAARVVSGAPEPDLAPRHRAELREAYRFSLGCPRPPPPD